MDTPTNRKRSGDNGDSITEREGKKNKKPATKDNSTTVTKTTLAPNANCTNTTLTCHTIPFLWKTPNHLFPTLSSLSLTSLIPQTVLQVSFWDKTPSTHRNHKNTAKRQVGLEGRPTTTQRNLFLHWHSGSTEHRSSNKKSLTSLMSLKPVHNKKILNPYLFWGAPMVTTFVRLVSNRTKELWQLIEGANLADIRLAKMERP